MGVQHRHVVCLNISGQASTMCLDKRPQSRRHCKGSCIEDSDSDYGWTKVIDGQQHSVYIDIEGNERIHVTNLTHKAEFLETAASNSKYSSCILVLVTSLLLNNV